MIGFAIAASVGAMVRYALEQEFNHLWHLGTIVANALGSLILGFAIARNLAPEFAVFCGAFTTFGGFVGQSFLDKKNHHVIMYIAVTLISSLTMAWLGLQMV